DVARPGELAVLDREVGGERDEEAVGHRVDERRAFLDRELLILLLRQGLAPGGEPAHGPGRAPAGPLRAGGGGARCRGGGALVPTLSPRAAPGSASPPGMPFS